MKYLKKEKIVPNGFIEAITEINPTDSQTEQKSNFANLNDTKPLRQFLLNEQHFLCLYCQSLIDLKTSQTEHYLSQKDYPEESIRYSNLYAGCECNVLKRATSTVDKSEMRNDFCGTKKGDKVLVWSPIKDPNAFATLTQANPFFSVNTESGEISGQGHLEAKTNEFIRICNLNHKLLKRARREAFKAITESELDLKEMIQRVASDPSQPYNQFILNGLII